MNIFLIRHADAEKASAKITDYDRQLTKEGNQKLKTAADGWKFLVPQFTHILSSPYLRAVQTAEIIKAVYNFTDEIIIDKRLAPGSQTEQLIELANQFLSHEMAFIGHEPDFSGHVSRFISNSNAKIDFKKGMIAKISFSGKPKLNKGTLEFLIPTKAYK